jgi:[acyl-carrier-protein] S-malonyltransferase
MHKQAIIFAGQGAQKAGMGKELVTKSKAAEEIFQIADDYSQGRISRLCFAGPQNELDLTINTQPCVFTVEIAYLEALRERGIEAELTAGFSLGEYGALVCSKVISFEDALRMVIKRGEFMNAAAESREGSMAAIMSIDNETLMRLCGEVSGYVEPVNFNCPGQTVVAGDRAAVTELVQKVKELSIGKAIQLAVSGAFHSRHMINAAEEYDKYIREIIFHDPVIPIVSNVTGDFVTKGEELKALAVQQIYSPVRWENSIRKMIESGGDKFVEAGPGKTLTGFMKKIAPDIEAVLADSFIQL